MAKGKKRLVHLKTMTFVAVIMMLLASCSLVENKRQITTKYAMGIVFRETPYTDIQGAKIVGKEQTQNVKHFEFDYDDKDRLIEFRYILNDELISFSDRFVRAPKIKIRYKDSFEIRTFFNEYGHRTLVSGDVYETHIKRNGKGERTNLNFYDIHVNPVENDFGIAKYIWVTEPNGDVMERRYNLKDELVRNRPEFQYMVTRFSFNTAKMLVGMTNLGLDGAQPTADDSGAISIRITYDADGRFITWTNFDADGSPVKGMTNIAKIVYKPSPFSTEQEAKFMNENDLPQHTNWGVHKVVYEFDGYGNEIKRFYKDTLNQPTNSNSGLGMVKSNYTKDGMHLQGVSYYDKEKKPIGFGENQVHELRVEFDENSRPICTSFYDLKGNLVNGWYGYATEATVFDSQGRIVERNYLDSNNKLVNNQEFDIARFVYQYKNEVELESVQTFNADGKEKGPQWNPNH